MCVGIIHTPPEQFPIHPDAHSSMNQQIFGNSLGDWAVALGSGGAVWAFITLFRGVLLRRLERAAAATPTIADDLLVEVIRSVRKTYVAVATLAIGLLGLQLPHSAFVALEWTAALMLVAQGVRTGNRLIEFWISRYTKTRGQLDRTTATALTIALRVAVFLVVAIVALHNLGVNVTTLITVGGVGGIAIALALQNILGDLFAALSIVLDKPFVVGDVIAVDALEGTVEHVGLKTTRLRSVNGEQLVFANGDLLRSRLRNFSRREGRRLVFTLVLSPGTSAARLAEVPALIRDIAAKEPRALLQRTHVVGFTLAGPEVETAIMIPHPDVTHAFDVRQDILLAIRAGLEARGVALATTDSLLLDRLREPPNTDRNQRDRQ